MHFLAQTQASTSDMSNNEECKICHKTFRNVQRLSNHQRSHNDDDFYECEICHLSFRGRRRIANHQRAHRIPSINHTGGAKGKTKTMRKEQHILFIDSGEEDHTILMLMEISEITLIWVGLGAF